jgi:hypothetical protein
MSSPKIATKSPDDVAYLLRTPFIDVGRPSRRSTSICRVVELRFFAGLNIDEAAEALGVSSATVEREWALAKAWLYRRLSSHA